MVSASGIAGLPAFSDPAERMVNVVVETTKGARAKLKYDPDLGLFRLAKVLPLGFSFPFDFGFIPGTRQGGGDPLDVLIMMAEPTAPGCLLEARPIGVVKLESAGERNDRIIAVWPTDFTYGKLEDFTELSMQAQIDIERFFRLYPSVHGERVDYLGCEGAAKALRLVREHAQGGRSRRREGRQSQASELDAR